MEVVKRVVYKAEGWLATKESGVTNRASRSDSGSPTGVRSESSHGNVTRNSIRAIRVRILVIILGVVPFVMGSTGPVFCGGGVWEGFNLIGFSSKLPQGIVRMLPVSGTFWKEIGTLCNANQRHESAGLGDELTIFGGACSRLVSNKGLLPLGTYLSYAAV